MKIALMLLAGNLYAAQPEVLPQGVMYSVSQDEQKVNLHPLDLSSNDSLLQRVSVCPKLTWTVRVTAEILSATASRENYENWACCRRQAVAKQKLICSTMQGPTAYQMMMLENLPIVNN